MPFVWNLHFRVVFDDGITGKPISTNIEEAKVTEITEWVQQTLT